MTPYALGARISPYAHPHAVAQSISLAAVKRGVRRDPKGDTILAQINPREAAMLRAAGGADRVDSRGIRHFYPGAGGAGGMGLGGAGGEAGSDPSGRGSGNGGGGNGGGYGPVMGGASGAYNSASQLAARDPITSASLANQRTYGSDSGPLGYLGRAFLGLGYMDPTDMNRAALTSGVAPPTSPDTGFDAPGMALGIGGALAGLPLGAGYLAGKTLFGAPKDFGMVDIGNWGNMGSWGGGPSNVGSNVGATGGGQHNGPGGSFGPGRITAPVPTLPQPPAVPAGPPVAEQPPGGVAGIPGLPGGVPPNPAMNPYMPWRQFMNYQNPANLGALPFATPYG